MMMTMTLWNKYYVFTKDLFYIFYFCIIVFHTAQLKNQKRKTRISSTMPACCLSRVKHVHILNLYLHASVKVQQKFCSTEILILCSTQHNQQTHTHCSFDILKMDNKRIKFSPSSIEQIEEETMARLMSSDNRYEVPEAFRGNQNSVRN